MKRERRKPTRAEWERMMPEERIPGKFSHQECESGPAPPPRAYLVTRTSGVPLVGGGR